MVYHNIQAYIAAKLEHELTPAVIHPDGTITVNSNRISAAAHKKMYKPPVYQPKPKANPNGHQNMNGVVKQKHR